MVMLLLLLLYCDPPARLMRGGYSRRAIAVASASASASSAAAATAAAPRVGDRLQTLDCPTISDHRSKTDTRGKGGRWKAYAAAGRAGVGEAAEVEFGSDKLDSAQHLEHARSAAEPDLGVQIAEPTVVRREPMPHALLDVLAVVPEAHLSVPQMPFHREQPLAAGSVAAGLALAPHHVPARRHRRRVVPVALASAQDEAVPVETGLILARVTNATAATCYWLDLAAAAEEAVACCWC